jgi:hypothetical protein
MKTGRDANRSGLYISECCLKEVRFLKGQMFSRCPRCKALTVWEFVKQKERSQGFPADPILDREDAEFIRQGISQVPHGSRLVE